MLQREAKMPAGICFRSAFRPGIEIPDRPIREFNVKIQRLA
jgi:hypothetical protein